MKVIVLFVVLSCAVSSALAQEIRLHQSWSESDEEFDATSLSKDSSAKIARLHSGLKRSEVENDFEADGGWNFGFRYFLRSVSVHNKRVVLELTFQPLGMPDDVYSDANRALQWRLSHDCTLPQPNDILRNVAKPFLAREHID